MANAFYDPVKESWLDGTGPDMDTDTIKVALVNTTTDYTFSAAHEFLDDVTTYSGTTDQTLGTKTVTDGVFDAADVTFSSVAISAGKDVEALVIYKDTGSAATSDLICYIDDFTAITPNGTDITVTFPSGANKIFAI